MYSISASSWFIVNSVELCITIVEVLYEPCSSNQKTALLLKLGAFLVDTVSSFDFLSKMSMEILDLMLYSIPSVLALPQLVVERGGGYSHIWAMCCRIG